MNSFSYERPSAADAAIHAGSVPRSSFLAGGTNLVDLMKYGVESPSTLVDINQLQMNEVTPVQGGGISIGALVKNSDLANHPLVVKGYPLLSQALLSGASPQLRNMASTGGNLMQRTRCYYFMDTAFPACNKRVPGSGCAAVKGYNRIHAVLGQTDDGPASAHTCIATNPSDMNVAMAALEATVLVQGPKGKRSIPFTEFHRLPGNSPQLDTTLRPGELITAVNLPAPRFAANSHYLKARDRNSYAFALVSVACGLEMANGTIRSAGLCLGGVAHKPWRSAAAEKALVGKPATPETFNGAATLALTGAHGYEHNAFKIELANQLIVRALTLSAQGTAQPSIQAAL